MCIICFFNILLLSETFVRARLCVLSLMCVCVCVVVYVCLLGGICSCFVDGLLCVMCCVQAERVGVLLRVPNYVSFT